MTSTSGASGADESAPLAPVIPLFGATPDAAWHPTWARDAPGKGAEAGSAESEGSGAVSATAATGSPSAEGIDPAVEKVLMRRLRGRSLSLTEARAVLRDHGVERATADDIVDRFVERGYLNDAALAEQVVHAATTRKAQGRQGVLRELQRRGIDREVAAAAIADEPDDDAERALEYARRKAPAMSSVAPDAALRRLTGQLARRGFPGSVAMSAARSALDEVRARRGPRFS